MKAEITVIILTLNEELHLRRCIESILPFTNSIFIVDSFSSDSTAAIAQSLGVNFYQNKWPGNHAKQFQWSLDNCPIETDWVMKMDADEFVLPKLADEINQKIFSIDKEVSGIYIKRRVNFMQSWMRHGGYYPTWLLRIWRHGSGIMEQRWMDEHIKLTSGTATFFENDIVDDNKNDLAWWITKHNNYSIKEAVEILNIIYEFRIDDGVEPKMFGTQEQRKRKLKNIYARLPLFWRPFIYFIWRYFVRLGFLDGKSGIVWHFLQGFWYRFLVDALIYEIYSKTGRDRDKIKKVLNADYGFEL